MASTSEFVQFAADQLRNAGIITWRKMFGEYGLYCDGVFFAMVCDNQLFIKITEAGKKLSPALSQAPPYEGAKPCFLIEEIEDTEFLTELARETVRNLPAPVPKKRTGTKGGREK